jgi:membrane protein
MQHLRSAWGRSWAFAQQRWAAERRRSPALDRLVVAYESAQSRHEPELASALTVRALLALVPAVAGALALLALVLRNPPEQRRLAGVLLDAFLPGLAGPLLPDEPLSLGAGTAAVLASVAVLGLGLGWVRALRRGIRAMWEQPLAHPNLFAEKWDDLLTLFAAGSVLVVCGITSFVGRIVLHAALDRWAPGAVEIAMSVGTQLVGLLGVWAAVAVVGTRVLPRHVASRRQVATMATVSAVCVTGLKLAFMGYAQMVGARNGSLYGTFAAVAGVLLWLSLTNRALLLSAAWTAVAGHAQRP